jgi:hypothetical protein
MVAVAPAAVGEVDGVAVPDAAVVGVVAVGVTVTVTVDAEQALNAIAVPINKAKTTGSTCCFI